MPPDKQTPIMFQLFTVRGECKKGLPDTFKGLQQAGYQGVELFGYNGTSLEWMGQPVQALVRMLKDNGLVCCGMHLSTDALLGDRLARTIEMNQALGSTMLIIAGDEKRMSALATIRELAGILDQTAEKLKPLGLFCGYHAHPSDFIIIEGQTAWDILFSQTRPEVVMQMDIGNCLHGKGDPLGTLEKFPGRCTSVHLKDFGGGPNTAIGEGSVDWKRALKILADLHRPQYYVVEQGGADGLGFDVPRRSLEALRKMGL